MRCDSGLESVACNQIRFHQDPFKGLKRFLEGYQLYCPKNGFKTSFSLYNRHNRHSSTNRASEI